MANHRALLVSVVETDVAYLYNSVPNKIRGAVLYSKFRSTVVDKLLPYYCTVVRGTSNRLVHDFEFVPYT